MVEMLIVIGKRCNFFVWGEVAAPLHWEPCWPWDLLILEGGSGRPPSVETLQQPTICEDMEIYMLFLSGS